MYTVKLDHEDPMCLLNDPFLGNLVYSQNKRQQVPVYFIIYYMYEVFIYLFYD